MPELTATEHAAQVGIVQKVRLTYGYYLQPNGWITVSPATQLEELQYRREGWEPLTAYGRVEMASQYAAQNPLEALFMFGGAKELSIEQILQTGLHLKPPLVPTCRTPLNQYHKQHAAFCWRDAQPVTFPQLEVVPEGLPCRFCERILPTPEAQGQHEQVAHQEERSSIRTGETLAEALVQGLQGQPGVSQDPQDPQETPPVPSATSAPNPYLCGFCHEGFNHPLQLAKHVKLHKEGANETEEGEGADD